jgi:hypothetical protein
MASECEILMGQLKQRGSDLVKFLEDRDKERDLKKLEELDKLIATLTDEIQDFKEKLYGLGCMQPPRPRGAGGGTSPRTVTQTPWAVLHCKFSDNTSDATMPNTGRLHDLNFFKALFTKAGTGTHNMVDFFRDMSHGSVDLSGSEVFDLVIDKKRSKVNFGDRRGLVDLVKTRSGSSR